mgnify:CR=1 FL=1
MIVTLITILHVVVCFVLILVILLQAGKSGGMGAAFGGGSGTVFGGRGAQTFLGKVTSVCAGIFMLTSVTLAYMASKSDSVIRDTPAPAAAVDGGTPAAVTPPEGAKPGEAAPAAPAPVPAPAK